MAAPAFGAGATMSAKPKSKDLETDSSSVHSTMATDNYLSAESVHARRHRKLLDELIACGMQKLIDIPKIAIVGSQSAGKSSILEVSQITCPFRHAIGRIDPDRALFLGCSSFPSQALSGVSIRGVGRVFSVLLPYLALPPDHLPSSSWYLHQMPQRSAPLPARRRLELQDLSSL
jgi:hypothetical protein